MAALFDEPKLGDRVRLVGGEKGYIREKISNFGFTLWEIQLQSGKVVSEARYRFDLITDPISTSTATLSQRPEPEITLQPTTSSIVSESNISESETASSEIQFHNNDKSKPKNKPKPRQFVEDDDACIDKFITEQENQATTKKTNSDLRTLSQFLSTKKENRPIYNIPVLELNNFLCQLFYSVRKSDGTEYEPSSLRGMICSFDRVLRKHEYAYQISKSPEFGKTREVVVAKFVDLKKQGKGNGDKKADSLTDEDVGKLFESGQLGLATPTSLLHTIWFFNTVCFGLRGVSEHYNMKWGDVKVCKDVNGEQFLELNERNTKTRTGKNIRDTRAIPPRAFQNKSNPNRCPVKAYLLYKSKRPAHFNKPDHPFYIQECTNTSKSDLLFKCQIVGKNKLGSFMKNMAVKAGLCSGEKQDNLENEVLEDENEDVPCVRRLTNHSARRYLVQKLDDSGVEHNHIKQITGHKNIQSVANYRKLNVQAHRNISNSILGPVTENTEDQCEHFSSSQVVYKRGSDNMVRTDFTAHHKTDNHPGTGIFSGPIYGGTFNITINNDSSALPPKKDA